MTDDTLAAFYGLSNLHPTSMSHIQVSDAFSVDSVRGLSREEQFGLLNNIINRKRLNHTRAIDVDKNVEDPLVGPGSNVIPVLMNNGVISSANDEDINNYLINSQSFNLQQFLTQVHSDSSIEQLTSYLRYIERSIKNQQQDVQHVIDSNFVNFINCKKAIDEVLVKFKQEKNKALKDMENSKIFLPSNSTIPAKDDSLTAYLEDSIKNLHTTLALMIRPIQEHTNKEAKLVKLIEFIKSNQFFFDLPTNIIKNISENNHDAVVDDYNRFLHEKESFYQNKIRKYEERIQSLTDEKEIVELQEERLLILTATSKLFANVEKIIAEYRKRIYKQLLGLDYEARSRNRNHKSNHKFIDLVDKIYQLDSNKVENPIAQFLFTQISALQDELEYQLIKFDDKFRMMQRKLTDHIGSLEDARQNGSNVRYIAEKYTQIESYFNASTTAMTEQEKEKVSLDIFGNSDNLDLSIINETWLVLINFVGYLEDNFTRSLKRFVTNYSHYGTEFNIDPSGQIQSRFEELINRTIDILILLFEDESTTATQVESIPNNFKQFLPHYTNSLSTVFYLTLLNKKLSRFLNGLGEFVGSVGNVNKSTESNKIIKSLRACSTKLNQIIVEATCAVWVNDCSQLYDLEFWEISHIEIGNGQDLDNGASYTKLMNIVENFHIFVLTKLHNLMYQKEQTTQEIRIISAHPSKRLLVSVEIQFIRCLNITLDSIMKKYNQDRKEHPNNETYIYKILTMNNFDVLSKLVYPTLIRKFDRLFAKDLDKQNLQIFANIENANRTIFDDIINKQKLKISQHVVDFFESFKGSQNIKVDGFIYEILMQFVKLIHNVKPITGTDIFINIVNELQQGVIKSILDNFRNQSNFGPIETLNLKLDVNFFMEVFESSRTLKVNEACFRVIEILLNTIEERLNELGHNDIGTSEFEDILNENLSVSASQFDCF